MRTSNQRAEIPEKSKEFELILRILMSSGETEEDSDFFLLWGLTA